MSDASTYLNLSQVQIRAARPDEHARCEQEFTAHHYLGEAHVAGDRGWQIAECHGQWVAVILWCAAAKRLKAREEWIGWDPRTRAERLKLVVGMGRSRVAEPGNRGSVPAAGRRSRKHRRELRGDFRHALPLGFPPIVGPRSQDHPVCRGRAASK